MEVFVDDDGKVILSYWKIKGEKRGIGLAKNIDNTIDKWEKFKENPVIKSTEWGITNIIDSSGKNTFVGSADPHYLEKEWKILPIDWEFISITKIWFQR